jgi:glycosyltransferase involved in cell wall biosynthesis
LSSSDPQPILIDVSRLIWRLWRGGLPTGVDRVCLAYVDHYRSRALAVVQRRDRYWVLNRRASKRLFQLIRKGSRGFRTGFIGLVLSSLLGRRRLPREKGLIYLNVGHTGLDDPALGEWVSQAGVRAIFFIHDLIPILHPEYCRSGEREKHERRMENALRFAFAIIGNSEATLTDLRQFAETRGLPVPTAVAAWIAGPPVPPDVVPKYFDRPHFVVVGTIEGRKNHELLLRIWEQLTLELGSGVPLLVVIGQRGWQAEAAITMLDRANEPGSTVIELSRCGDDELAAIIAGARALLMPSFAEGFGLPVVEALKLGTPVIASDLPVFREIVADIPTFVACTDESAFADAIKSFLEDGPERKRQLATLGSYSPPDWPTHFKIIDSWIETLSQ